MLTVAPLLRSKCSLDPNPLPSSGTEVPESIRGRGSNLLGSPVARMKQRAPRRKSPWVAQRAV